MDYETGRRTTHFEARWQTMNCDTFHKEYNRFTDLPKPREVWEAEQDEYSDWIDHMHDCNDCGEWYLLQQVINRGHNPELFPCIHLAYYSTHPCDQHEPQDCPDILVLKTKNGFAIPVRDGGSSVVGISHCPWCGKEI